MTSETDPRESAVRKKIVILHNRRAGGAGTGRISAVLQGLEQQGAKVSLLAAADLATLPQQIAALVQSAPDVIVVAGGDGTINKIMQHLGPTEIPLALLPVGTANVLAHSLKIPQASGSLVQYILHGPIREAWPGTANGHCFCCMASVGFDANVVAGVNLKLKSVISKGAYVVEALSAVLRHKDQEFAITADDRPYRAYGAVITLTPFYGGRFLMAPGASPFASDFAVCLFKGRGRLSLLRYAGALAMGTLATLPDVEIIAARQVEICSSRAGVVQVDGDIASMLPVSLSRTAGIRLIVPAG